MPEKAFSVCIKDSVFIDPPYNTGEAFEYYDDNPEHSIWLNLMYARLQILRNLLAMMDSFAVGLMIPKDTISKHCLTKCSVVTIMGACIAYLRYE